MQPEPLHIEPRKRSNPASDLFIEAVIPRHTAGHKHHLQQGIAVHQGKGRFFPQRKLGMETRKSGQRK